MKIYNKFSLLILLGFLLTTSCTKKVYLVKEQTPHYYKFNKNKFVDKDQKVESLIDPFRDKMKSEMDEILVYSDVELIKKKPNCNMGNWMTDIILSELEIQSNSSIDCTFQNYGGIRIKSMPAGPITKGKIYEVMPFENMAVILHVSGTILRQLCDRIVRYGGWPVSGIEFSMGKNKIAENILIKGIPIDNNKIYNIGLADYIANGGDGCDFLKDAKRTETGILVRTLLIDHLRKMKQKNQNIISNDEERIK